MRVINSMEVNSVSGGGVDDPMDGNADIAIGSGSISFEDFGMDAAATREKGSNSWGEKPEPPEPTLNAGGFEKAVRECNGNTQCWEDAYQKYRNGLRK